MSRVPWFLDPSNRSVGEAFVRFGFPLGDIWSSGTSLLSSVVETVAALFYPFGILACALCRPHEKCSRRSLYDCRA
jgi:hypothetical protein